MYRMLVVAVLSSLVLPGCSLGTQSLSLGLGETASVAAETPRRTATAGLGGDPQASRTQVAAFEKASLDKAPKGTFDRAPAGALADRDYTDTKLDAEKARDLINAYRKEKGLKPLALNTELTSAAKAHSRDLAKWDRISHYGSDGSNPWDRVKRAGYNARVAAENVGTGQATIDEVFKGWKASPGHNKNLLMGDVDNMGIALVQDPKTEFKTFWTLVLASRL